MHVLDELRARGLMELVTDEAALRERLDAGPVAFYAGYDPTAKSLHIGHLAVIMTMAHLQRAGHRPIALVGGATGLIGDPSGRDTERSLQTEADVDAHKAGLRAQLARFLTFDGPAAATLVDNLDWIQPVSLIEWLRETGKYFTINYMIAKESVKRRLESREQGISYTEFTYMMVQAYDFWHLRRARACELQVGGNDQWGNITAGTDLIHKRDGARAFGMTVPLITTAAGEKFGKSAGNAVWLDADLTTPYAFYQFWMNADDADLARWFRIFTFLPLADIDALVAEHAADPGRRAGQRRLAQEVTRIVHGDDGVRRAEQATAILFGGTIEQITDADVAAIFGDVPTTLVPRAELEAGLPWVDLLARTVVDSKGAARRLIKQGGAYLNNHKVDDETRLVTLNDLVSESALVLRSGKRSFHVVRTDR